MSYREGHQKEIAVMRAEYQHRIYSLCDTLELYDPLWKLRLAEAMFDLPPFDLEADVNKHGYMEIINDICRRDCCYYALDDLFFRKAEMLCEKYSEAAQATWIKN